MPPFRVQKMHHLFCSAHWRIPAKRQPPMWIPTDTVLVQHRVRFPHVEPEPGFPAFLARHAAQSSSAAPSSLPQRNRAEGRSRWLRRSEIDPAACALTVRRSRLRPKWKHGHPTSGIKSSRTENGRRWPTCGKNPATFSPRRPGSRSTCAQLTTSGSCCSPFRRDVA